MSQAPETICLRPRFKGIENFLRRIAFNLGNTPSQTEVKIISCIPIDVTDLQNKIVELEKELDERERGDRTVAPAGAERAAAAAVHTALGVPTFTPRPALRPTAPSSTSGSDPSPDLPPSDATHPRRPNDDVKLDPNKKTQQKLKNMGKKKSRGKTQMVYYAQTQSCAPFTSNEHDGGARNKRRVFEQQTEQESYLADVVRRQYQPERVDEEPSSSHFSWPVCRDEPAPAPLPLLDSDMCSCCHGPFHDLDSRPPPPAAPQPPARRDCNMYYDSSQYDVVPVRDRPSDIMYGKGFYCDGGEKIMVDRDRIRERARPRQYIVNFNTTSPAFKSGPKLRYKKKLATKSCVKREQVIRAMQQRRKLDRCSSAETSHNSCVECGEVYTKPAHPRPHEPSPPSPRPSLPPPAPSPPPVLLKNAECLTMSVNDTECQTATSRSVQIEPVAPEQNKTEITLNQIKSILHAVLTEVKTNSQIKSTVEDKAKKDAIVQKGPSQSNIATDSSSLNDYTYSPQNMNPFEMSLSGQMFGSQPCYPQGVPGAPAASGTVGGPRAQGAYGAGLTPYAHAKCLQNYPLFIHTTGRQCACCYRGFSQPARVVQRTSAPPAHTATNTETMLAVGDQRSKETDKLIKEIYKSLAMNMAGPQKQSSSSDYTDLKSSANNSQKKFEFKFEAKPKPKFASPEVTKRQVHPTSVFMSKGFAVNLPSNRALTSTATATATATATQAATTTSSGSTESSEAACLDRIHNLLAVRRRALASTGSEREPEPVARYPRTRRAAASVSEEDTETRSTSTDSDATVVADQPKRKEKIGLFSKMKQLFSSKPRRRRKKDDDQEREQDQTSDSDDYETVYSGRSNRHEKKSTRRSASPPVRRAQPTPPAHRAPHSPSALRSPHSPSALRSPHSPSALRAPHSPSALRAPHSPSALRAPHSPSAFRTPHSPPALRASYSPPAIRASHSPPALRASHSPRHLPHSKVSYSRYHMPRRDNALRARRSPYMEQEYRRYWNENLMFHGGDTPRCSSEQPFASVGRRSPYHRTYEARAAVVSPPGRRAGLYLSPQHHRLAQEQVGNGRAEAVKASALPKTADAAFKGLAFLKKKYQPSVRWTDFFRNT